MTILVNDLRTWIVWSLNWDGSIHKLVDVLVGIKAYITAVQEVRWSEQRWKLKKYLVALSRAVIKMRKFGVGFMVGEKLRRRKHLATIDINLSLIYAHIRRKRKTM